MDTLNQPPSPQPAVQQTPVPPKPTVNSKTLLIAVAVFIVIMIGLISYVLAARTKPTSQPPTISPALSQPSPTPDPTANWKTYVNTIWNYQFQYPSTWIVDELDMEHTVVTTPDIEKSTDGRIIKFQANYIRVNIIKRENVTSSFEEEIKLVYTESPQCSVGSECPSSPPLITKKTNTNSLEYYFLTTGVYHNELAIFPLSKDKNNYVLIDPRRALTSNIKIPDKILSTFQFSN